MLCSLNVVGLMGVCLVFRDFFCKKILLFNSKRASLSAMQTCYNADHMEVLKVLKNEAYLSSLGKPITIAFGSTFTGRLAR